MLCAGAVAEDVAEEVREAEVEKDEDSGALEDAATDDEEIIVALRLWDTEARVDGDAEPDRVTEPEMIAEPEAEAKTDEIRDAIKVGVTMVVGTASLSVGTATGTV